MGTPTARRETEDEITGPPLLQLQFVPQTVQEMHPCRPPSRIQPSEESRGTHTAGGRLHWVFLSTVSLSRRVNHGHREQEIFGAQEDGSKWAGDWQPPLAGAGGTAFRTLVLLPHLPFSARRPPASPAFRE